MPMKHPGRLLFIWTRRWEDREADRQTETRWRKTWTEFLNTTEASSQKSLDTFVSVGVKIPQWPEGERPLTHEKESCELQKCTFSPKLLISASSDIPGLPLYFKNGGLYFVNSLCQWGDYQEEETIFSLWIENKCSQTIDFWHRWE